VYFNPPKFEDHWVCEYWDADGRRWALADAQLDAIWCERIRVSFDTCDVRREQFLTAADAWQRCRRGAADPQILEVSFAGSTASGSWRRAWIRDLAALLRRYRGTSGVPCRSRAQRSMAASATNSTDLPRLHSIPTPI